MMQASNQAQKHWDYPDVFSDDLDEGRLESDVSRAAQRLNLSAKKRRRQQHLFPHVRGHGNEVVEPPCFRTNFCDVLRSSAPSVPPSLLRSLGRKENFALGKVKVMLRIAPSSGTSCEASPFLNVDSRKKQLTVFDPTMSSSSSPTTDRNRTTSGISAPKMFAFDAIFSPDDTQTEVCSSSLPEVIQSVVGGSDGCLFVYGHSKLGKTHTMIGSSDSVQGLGVIPCAISWLFRLIHEQRQKTGARFSVRLSAIEISGRNEALTDLLSEYAAGTEGSGTSPGVYLREDPVLGAQLINASELRAPSAEKAGYLVDAALAARNTDGEDEGRDSHFLFTLHVYQYRVDRSGKGGVAGGRSRLHLFDLGSCEKTQAKPRDSNFSNIPTSLSFSALGNVILALFNGQKHLPNKESKLTQMLKEATNSLTCRVAMIAHISSSPQHYSEVLATVQLAARIHRMRRKKIKGPSNVTMENVYDEKGACVRPFVRMHAEDGIKNGNSDADYTSSSEQSCDTVIFVGSGRMSLSDRRQNDHSAQAIAKLNLQKSPSSDAKEPASANSNCTSQRKQELLRDSTKHSSSTNSRAVSRDEPTSKSNCNINAKESATSRLKQQPASTQTPRTECTNSPLKVSTAQRKKHKSSGSKQDAGSSKESPQATSAGKTGSVKEVKPQSDETWIDGPRFSKPKFDSKTLHRLQKEQWVDGPPVIYGFMDDHKQSMIRKWVEEHSHLTESKGQPWSDSRPKNEDKKESATSADSKGNEEKIVNTSNKVNSKDEPEYAVPCRVRSKPLNSSVVGDSKQENVSRDVTDYSCYGGDLNSEHDEIDSASNSADVDETDNEENVENGPYGSDLQYALSTGDEYNRGVETIEVEEPDEPVPTVDSCLQVNEEDIIAECWFQSVGNSLENPFAGINPSREHPLRVLSEEGLNLPSSFSDSRSVSIDLDSVSVPDTCRDIYRGKGGVTWRLLYGNMFQKIKEQQQLKQMNESAKNGQDSSIDEKLKQIARLREMVHPLTKRERPDKASLPLSLAALRTKPDAWPSDISCYALSEMMRGSSDSSLSEDLSEADINSTKSEPAELDLDKYDFKFNVKPMNGLKLEAFYNKIHKVPPFSKHYENQKPTQIVPPLISDEENKQLLDKIESYQLESFTKERSNSFSHRPPLKNFMKDTLDAPPFLRRPTFSSFHGRFETTSNPQLHQASFLTNAPKNNISLNISDNAPFSTKSLQRNLESTSKVDNTNSSELVSSCKRNDQRSKPVNLSSKTIDTRQLTVGSSPTNSAKARSSQRSKLNDCGKNSMRDQPLSSSSNSSIQSKDLSISCSSTSSKTAQRTILSNNSKTPLGKHSNNNNVNYCNSANCQSKTNGCSKRTSPTSNGSSTSGITTTCCSTVKQREKPSCAKGKSFQQDQSKHKRCESKRQAKNASTKSICRSTSSPSTCVDSGDTALTDVADSSDQYFVSRHASISNTLSPASPYHKVGQSRYHNHNHHHRHHKQRTSSGNGSDSSVNSLEPREAKDLLVIKGTTKTQQFSGTSSGYESMLRDSEGTPLSSSQESGTEGSVGRGRKGRRKSQGSSKRSLSAPARSPASSTSASRPPAAVNQQPSSESAGGAVLLLRPRTALDRRSDEEICCPSLLCCRLLDFY